MDPVPIKLYGLFRRTRQQYLRQQLLAVVLALSLLVVWASLPQLEMDPEQGIAYSPELVQVMGIMERIPWIVALLLALIAAETVIVLRLFARKAGQLSSPAATPADQPSP